MSLSPDIYRIQLQQGMFSRVAKTLSVDRSHVSRVATGERRSPRVERAIRNEMKRIQRLVEKYEQEQQRESRTVAA